MSQRSAEPVREATTIPFDGAHVDALSAIWDLPGAVAAGAAAPRQAVLLAHGAGAPMDVPLLDATARALAAHGVPCLRFLYPYTERARREERRLPPDRAPVLMAAHRAAAAVLRARFPDARRVFGGKSMGGRMASLIAAEGDDVDALFFLGYPLHPAGKPERLRAEHFAAIELPALFLQGDRDALCDLALLDRELERWGGAATVHVERGADHGFDVRKKDGRTPDEVRTSVTATLLAWLGAAEPEGPVPGARSSG